MKKTIISALLASLIPLTSNAHEIKSAAKDGVDPAFDISLAAATTDGAMATFMLEVTGTAGSVLPAAIGALKGAKVNAYVWPTSLDPEIIGFAPKSGILALAITAHPDFDDTPLYDENGDGDMANDGKSWHSHWVVLEKDAACAAGLKVRDVAPGADMLPKTAPGLPLAIDSPGMVPSMDGRMAKLTVPLSNAENASFDGVTAELQVNAAGEKPLLCVIGVHDVASGDLSLPGKITKAQ